MERRYWLMALFGAGAALGLILASYLFYGAAAFSGLFRFGLLFVARIYLFSLTFFVMFTVGAAARLPPLHNGRSARWFALSLLNFTLGSVLGAMAFVLLFALIAGTAGAAV